MLTDIDSANNLVELFLKRADEKADQPFLGAKIDGSWQTLSWRGSSKPDEVVNGATAVIVLVALSIAPLALASRSDFV